VVFNSAFFAGDVAKGATGMPGFWTAPPAPPGDAPRSSGPEQRPSSPRPAVPVRPGR
jgi:hypothetical protein